MSVFLPSSDVAWTKPVHVAWAHAKSDIKLISHQQLLCVCAVIVCLCQVSSLGYMQRGVANTYVDDHYPMAFPWPLRS